LYCIKIIMSMESPHKTQKTQHVCVCVCVLGSDRTKTGPN